MEKWARLYYQPNLPFGKKGYVTGSAEHIALSREAAKEGMVLLKNEGNALPLAEGTRVALLGKGNFDYVKGGGGSGDVTTAYITNLYEGLKRQDGIEIEPKTAAFYESYVKTQYGNGGWPGMIAEPALPGELLAAAARFADTAVISISRYSGEGWDRNDGNGPRVGEDRSENDPLSQYSKVFPEGDYYLSPGEAALVEQAKAAFAKVVVVLNVGSAIDSEWFVEDGKIQAVLMAWQGGQEGGLAAAELLVGKGNPSGKLADTLVKALADYPSTAGFHASKDYVEYTEDIYVGYRYFETIPGKKERVNYPFGFGLSYTTFCVEDVRLTAAEDTVKVSAKVTNTGKRAGREVLQVYAEAPQGKLGKAARSLAGYEKTRLLQPGESQQLFIDVPLYALASYDDLGKVKKAAWVLEKGSYTFHVGTSVRETVAVPAFTLEEDKVLAQCESRLTPSALKERLLSDGSFEALPTGEAPRQVRPLKSLEELLEYAAPDVEAYSGMEARQSGDHGRFARVASGELSLEEFVAGLTDREVALLLGGQPNTGVANTFGIGNLPKYGVPNAMTADGPAGLRINEQVGVCTTAFPCATLLACTWDPQVTEAVGRAGAEEVWENNITTWLMPAINIHRNPLCGRNFEYYAEDPFLAGKQAAAIVRGVQSKRVGTSVKHFALNNKETNRKFSDSRVSERAAREIYLKAFEIIVKEAKPWTIMTSYNLINGIYSSEREDLLTGILRGEWGFDGLVTTDWWNGGEQFVEVKAGNDLKMGCGYADRLLEAKEKGHITRGEMEVSAKRVLELILKFA